MGISSRSESGLRRDGLPGLAAGVALLAVSLSIGPDGGAARIPESGAAMAAAGTLCALSALMLWVPRPVLRHYEAVVVLVIAAAAVLSGTHPGVDWGRGPVTEGDAWRSLLPMLLLIYGLVHLELPVLVAMGGALSVLAWLQMLPGDAEAAWSMVGANALGALAAFVVRRRERRHRREQARAHRQSEALRGRADRAEKVSIEKTRLLAAISHDLRQPMAAVRLHAHAMGEHLRRGHDERARGEARAMAESVDVLGATLENLLAAARYEAGEHPVEIHCVAVDALAAQVVALYAAQAQARGLQLRVSAPAIPVLAQTDAHTMHRILSNLVSNALKFTESRGRPGRGVVVRVAAGAHACRIQVADTGAGIAEKDLHNIWAAFHQLGRVERERRRGLGLGLYLVQHAIQCLPGHRIDVRSRAGFGTRFTITLPAADASGGFPHTEDRSLDLLGMHVLLLEPDEAARARMCAWMTGWGVHCIAAAGLDELICLRGDSARPVDAVILATATVVDVPQGRLALSDRLHELAELRVAVAESAEALLLTDASELDTVVRRLPAGVSLMRKPLTAHGLLAWLHDALSLRLAREESMEREASGADEERKVAGHAGAGHDGAGQQNAEDGAAEDTRVLLQRFRARRSGREEFDDSRF